MKKLVSLLLLSVIFLANLKLSSAALGLSPAIAEINFRPYDNYTITYQIHSDKPDRNIDIYFNGILENYTFVDKKRVKGASAFQLTINLPGEIKEPGAHNFIVGVKENVSEEDIEGFFGTAIAIEAIIKVYLPYPGKYVEISDFSVEDVNLGQPLVFVLEVINRGKENVTTAANLELYKGNEKIDDISLGEKFLETHQKKVFKKQLDSSKYGPGKYNVTATVSYGDPNRIPKRDKIFRIGTLLVDVINWTREFYVKEINKFIVEVESNWNTPLDKVYAHVFVYDKDNLTNVLAEFKTTPENLERWLRKNLTGHLEAYNIKEPGIYKANITVFYETNSTTKIVDIAGKRRTNIAFIVIGIAVFILIALTIIILIIRRKRRKLKDENEQSKKKEIKK